MTTQEQGRLGRAVVAGATGYLGGHVVRALRRDGWAVRALARDRQRMGAVGELCEDVFVGEATDRDTLEGLFAGVDVAFSQLPPLRLQPVQCAPLLFDLGQMVTDHLAGVGAPFGQAIPNGGQGQPQLLKATDLLQPLDVCRRVEAVPSQGERRRRRRPAALGRLGGAGRRDRAGAVGERCVLRSG